MPASFPDFGHRYFAIEVAALPRATALAPGSPWAKLAWKATDGSSRGWLCCDFGETNAGELSLRIPAQYAWQGGSLRLLAECEVPVIPNRRRSLPPRYAFRCPYHETHGRCDGESSTLYLPPEQQVFACPGCAQVPADQALPEPVDLLYPPARRWSWTLPLTRTVLALARSF